MLLPRRNITLLMECPFKALQGVPGDAQLTRLLATPRKQSRARPHPRDIWGARQDEFLGMLPTLVSRRFGARSAAETQHT